MSISDATIKRAREIIAAASPPPYTVGTFAGDNHAGHVALFTGMLALAPDELKCWTVVIPDGDRPIEEFSLSVAITGNGPTSEANALYIKHSHDPVGGWSACLDEIELLDDEIRTLRRVTRAEVERLKATVQELRAALGEGLASLGTKHAADLASTAGAFSFAAFYSAKAKWSRETFGPGDRYAGVVAHIRKELLEIEAAPSDLEEWVDVALLAMDGAWRSAGADGAGFVAAMVGKDAKNRTRIWPDWRTLKPGEVSEHVKDAATLTAIPSDGDGFDLGPRRPNVKPLLAHMDAMELCDAAILAFETALRRTEQNAKQLIGRGSVEEVKQPEHERNGPPHNECISTCSACRPHRGADNASTQVAPRGEPSPCPRCGALIAWGLSSCGCGLRLRHG